MERALSMSLARQIVRAVGPLSGWSLLVAQPDGTVLAGGEPAEVGRHLRLPGETHGGGEGEAPAVEWLATAALVPVEVDGLRVCLLGLTPCGTPASPAAAGTTDAAAEEPDAATRAALQTAAGLTALLITAHHERLAAGEWWDDKQRFLEEWLLSPVPIDDPALAERAHSFGIDANRARCAGVLLLDPPAAAADGEEGAEAYLTLVRSFFVSLRTDGGRETPAAALGDRVVVLLDSETPGAARERLQQLRDQLAAASTRAVFGGVGMPRRTFAEVRDSVREAERAARMAKNTHTRQIQSFGDIALELLVQEVPARAWREFRQRMLRGVAEAEVAETLQWLTVYYQTDGSLAKTAARLGIHKNTLQYRLRRLAGITGHDPRRLRDALALYLTTLFAAIHDQT